MWKRECKGIRGGDDVQGTAASLLGLITDCSRCQVWHSRLEVEFSKEESTIFRLPRRGSQGPSASPSTSSTLPPSGDPGHSGAETPPEGMSHRSGLENHGYHHAVDKLSPSRVTKSKCGTRVCTRVQDPSVRAVMHATQGRGGPGLPLPSTLGFQGNEDRQEKTVPFFLLEPRRIILEQPVHCGSDGKESACNAGDPDLIPGSGRSPGGKNGNPLQYSCVEKSMDRGVCWATVHGNLGAMNTMTQCHMLMQKLKSTQKNTAAFGGSQAQGSSKGNKRTHNLCSD